MIAIVDLSLASMSPGYTPDAQKGLHDLEALEEQTSMSDKHVVR